VDIFNGLRGQSGGQAVHVLVHVSTGNTGKPTQAEGSAKQLLVWIQALTREMWLYGDPVEADGTQSLFRSGRGKPKFIQVATFLQKVIPHRQSYVCGLLKGTSAKVDIVRLEPTLSELWQDHGSMFLVQQWDGIRLGVRDLLKDDCCFAYNYSLNLFSHKGRVSPLKRNTGAGLVFGTYNYH
jgi:hypothetical protein